MSTAEVFKVSLSLEEDVDAELEDFAGFARLGLIEESYEVLETALKNHLHLSAVVEEVLSFLLSQRDWTNIEVLARKIVPERKLQEDNPKLFTSLKSWANAPIIGISSRPRYQCLKIPEHAEPHVVATMLLANSLHMIRTVKQHFSQGMSLDPTFESLKIKWRESAKADIIHLLTRQQEIADLPWEAIQSFELLCWLYEELSENGYNSTESDWILIDDTYAQLNKWLSIVEPKDMRGDDPSRVQNQRTCHIRLNYIWLQHVVFRPSHSISATISLRHDKLPRAELTYNKDLGVSSFGTDGDVAAPPRLRSNVLQEVQILEEGDHQYTAQNGGQHAPDRLSFKLAFSLSRMLQPDREVIVSICRDTLDLLSQAFDGQDDATPRGRIFDFCLSLVATDWRIMHDQVSITAQLARGPTLVKEDYQNSSTAITSTVIQPEDLDSIQGKQSSTYSSRLELSRDVPLTFKAETRTLLLRFQHCLELSERFLKEMERNSPGTRLQRSIPPRNNFYDSADNILATWQYVLDNLGHGFATESQLMRISEMKQRWHQRRRYRSSLSITESRVLESLLRTYMQLGYEIHHALTVKYRNDNAR